MKKRKQGVTTIDFCGREIQILRQVIYEALDKAKKNDGSRMAKLEIAYLKRLHFKVNGSYFCRHCGQWVNAK